MTLEPEAQLARAQIRKAREKEKREQAIIAQWKALPKSEQVQYTVEHQVTLAKLKKRLPSEFEAEVRAGAITDPPYLIHVVKVPIEPPPVQEVKPRRVEPKPTWKETTISSRIYEGTLFGPKSPMATILERMSPRYFEKKTSREFTAGAVGIAESWIRPDIPTPSGALVGIALGRPEQFQAYQKGEVSLAYLAGGLYGTYIEAKAFGYGLTKAFSGIKYVTPEVVKRPVATVVKTIKFSRVAKAVHKTTLAIKSHTPEFLRRGPISPGEIVIPPAPEKVSLKALEASKLAWELTQFPRTGGVWVGKTYVTEAIKPPMKHLFYTGGKLTVGYLRDLSYVKPTEHPGILPFVTQKQVTRMGVVPYVPKLVAPGIVKVSGRMALGFAVATVARPRRLRSLTPTVEELEVYTPTLAKQREMFRSITVMEPLKREKQRRIPILKVPPVLEIVTEQKQKSMLRVDQKFKVPKLTVPRLVSRIPPSIQKFDPFRPPRRIPRRDRAVSRRRRKDLFGAWFKREHKIASPEEVMSAFFGSSSSRRRKKERAKRRKRK